MLEKKDELIHLIMDENVSAIQTIVEELSLSSDEVIELISKLLETGELKGTLAEDGQRFFKSDVKLSEAPSIERDDAPPSFMTFNTRPGRVTIIIGVIVFIGGVIVNAFAGDMVVQNFAALLMLIGLLITISGLYCISRRETPS
ncbi:MAG: hypothetical protein ThorAB25_25930 [Candidatus Thorarchaeota archaeon AB_25]|nr:MAG: hypothetical protein ThorAB25_25930 [Candidatus Thorarchaeota archaeon AB_25]